MHTPSIIFLKYFRVFFPGALCRKGLLIAGLKIFFITIAVLFFSLHVFSQDLPRNWYADELNPGEDIILHQEPSTIYDSAYSCKMVLLSDRVPYLYSSYYDVSEGDEYTFTLWYLDNDTTASLKVYADFIDGMGGSVFGEEPAFSEDSDEWQSLSWSATIPEGAVQGRVQIKLFSDPGFNGEAVIYVDAASFVVNGSNQVFNGSFEQWSLMSVPDTGNNPLIIVYPNPAGSSISISGMDYDRIEIYNLLGQQVQHSRFIQTQVINIEELTSGYYVVKAYKDGLCLGSARLLKK